MRPDALFRLASITKPMVTTAAMRMIELGQLSLEGAVTDFLPDFKPRLADGTAPVITIRHLLTHTAGLAYDFLRRLEHRLQYYEDQQTQALPVEPGHRAAIAEAMDFPDWDSLAAALGRHRAAHRRRRRSYGPPRDGGHGLHWCPERR